jgi:hypothetical protein
LRQTLAKFWKLCCHNLLEILRFLKKTTLTFSQSKCKNFVFT